MNHRIPSQSVIIFPYQYFRRNVSIVMNFNINSKIENTK